MYQIDAFAHDVFSGNPAAVCPLEKWLPDSVMQSIAVENNLSETAFFVRNEDRFGLRWFTPGCEVDLCGHATLATAFLLFAELGYTGYTIRFDTRSGELRVARTGDGLLEMDFPAQSPVTRPAPEALIEGLGRTPDAVFLAEDYIAVFDRAEDVASLAPDMYALRKLDARGVAATAPGNDVDFVSRFFAPKLGIDEDPVTGSVHCALAPYWSARLGKKKLRARQISARGGELSCTDRGDRIGIAGMAVKYLEGVITIHDRLNKTN